MMKAHDARSIVEAKATPLCFRDKLMGVLEMWGKGVKIGVTLVTFDL